MKNYLLLLLIFAFEIAYSQSNYEDVVYLKNGSIIHGIIVEQVPNKSIKIKTKDNNIFVFTIEEIEKLTKELPIIEESRKRKSSLDKWRPTAYVSFALNYSLPFSDFKEKYRYNFNDGNALPGYSASLGAHIELLRGFGFAAKYIYQNNASDQTSYAQRFATSTNNVTLSGNWQFHKILVGPQLFLRLSNKSSMNIYVLGGLQSGKQPDVKIRGNLFLGNTENYSYQYDSFLTAEVLFGWNLKVKLSNNFGIFSNLEFDMSHPTFKTHLTFSQFQNDTYSYSNEIRINSLNLGVGVVYMLK